MIALNLIPDGQKILLKNTRLYAACKEAVTLIFLFAMIISIMLWISRFYLERDLADLVVANATNIKSNEATNQRILAINQKIILADGIENNFISSRQAIESISKLVPENIALDSINYYRQQSYIELAGTAKTRNDLVAFKDSLRAVEWITAVDLPMTDLIEKENNKFKIRISADLAKIN